MSKRDNNDLFEQIHSIVGCEYLSDLKSIELKTTVIEIMKYMDIKQHALHEWESVISYLFDEEVSFSSDEEVYAYLAQAK